MKKKQNHLSSYIRRAAITAGILFLAAGSFLPVKAETKGWRQEGSGWRYQCEDASFLSGTWMWDGNAWFAFDEQGYMRTGWFMDEQGFWYYLQADGAMKTGWFQDGEGDWYYLEESGAMKIGWHVDNGRWYYLDETGRMAEDAWVGEYYMDASGAWVEGRTRLADFTEDLKASILALKGKYPEGRYWNHMGVGEATDYSESVTDIPCDHSTYGLTYCNYYQLGNIIGYQCDGFSRKLSDEIFGREAMKIDYAYDFDRIKVGDYLRFSNSRETYASTGHTVFVIDKTDDYVTVVEANYYSTCMIHWGGVLTRNYLDSVYAEGFTRY